MKTKETQGYSAEQLNLYCGPETKYLISTLVGIVYLFLMGKETRNNRTLLRVNICIIRMHSAVNYSCDGLQIACLNVQESIISLKKNMFLG